MHPCGVFDKTYGKDIAIVRTWQHWTILVLSILLLFLLPFIVSHYIVSFVNQIFVNVIVILGLQIVMGYCGQISLGQPAFVAVGAYTSAVLTIHYGFPFWVALPLSGIMAGIIGIVGGGTIPSHQRFLSGHEHDCHLFCHPMVDHPFRNHRPQYWPHPPAPSDWKLLLRLG